MMDAMELLKSWPGWANAGAEMVLASPAWRLPVKLGEMPGTLRLGGEALSDTINLAITLDDEPHVLSLADSSLYPDLHLLWSKRQGLPPEVLLALLERECGPVFSMLENATRKLLGVKGLVDAPAAEASAMKVDLGGGEFALALDLPPAVRTQWGRLENLDVAHPAIRAMTRPAWVDYCALEVADAERQAMAAGDFLLVPEDFAPTQRWVVEPPADAAVHLVSEEPQEISFGAFADEALPAIAVPETFAIVSKGETWGKGALAHLGIARAVRLT